MLKVMEKVLMSLVIIMKFTDELQEFCSLLSQVLEIAQVVQNFNCKALQLKFIKSKEVNVWVINSDILDIYFELLFQRNAANMPITF